MPILWRVWVTSDRRNARKAVGSTLLDFNSAGLKVRANPIRKNASLIRSKSRSLEGHASINLLLVCGVLNNEV